MKRILSSRFAGPGFALGLVLLVALPALSADIRPDPLCGPKCLLFVCKQMGIEASLEELCILSGYRLDEGTSLDGLYQAVTAKGLKAMGVKIGLDELRGLHVTAIAHLWGSHFVVVQNGDGNTMRVTDPPGEPRLVATSEFSELYSGFALLVSKEDARLSISDTDGPDLRADGYNYDAGSIASGSRTVHSFKLRNAGNEDLILSQVRTGCTCTSAVSTHQRLPPGDTGEIVVTFDSTGLQGIQSQTVYVHSNDPISPVIQLSVGGIIKPRFLVLSSRSLNCGIVNKGTEVRRRFLVRDPGDGSLEVNDCTSDSPFVTVSAVPDANNDRSGYIVEVTVLPTAPVGSLAANITLSTNHADEPHVKIPIAATIRGDLEVSPGAFFLGLTKKGQRAEKTISLSTNGKAPLRIDKIESPFDYILVTLKPMIEGKHYTVTASLDNTAPAGNIKGDVVIRTNNPDQPEIRVPVFAFVEHE